LILTDRIILASASPRRKHLLETVGLPFEVRPADVEEESFRDPEKTVLHNAKKKCLAIASENPARLVLGVDTLVYCRKRILGKPRDELHALEMLRLLNGKEHTVYTGICLMKGKRSLEKCSKTKVLFDRMTDKDLRFYVRTHKPFDKAGAYGIQEFSSFFIRKIDGDYFTVVGLPLNLLYRMLKAFGYRFGRGA
jgi:septum formation protein